MAKNVNVLNRAKDVEKDVEGFYEPGNQSRSKIQAYRQVVRKKHHISERTFWRYMELASGCNANSDQLCLEFY